MTRTLIATPEVRLRPAVVATLITLTFFVGIGAGLGLARVTAGSAAHQAALGNLGGSATEMSAAAYSAAHQAALGNLGNLAAACSATVQAGTDMSSAVYAATHPAGIDKSSAGCSTTQPQ